MGEATEANSELRTSVMRDTCTKLIVTHKMELTVGQEHAGGGLGGTGKGKGKAGACRGCVCPFMYSYYIYEPFFDLQADSFLLIFLVYIYTWSEARMPHSYQGGRYQISLILDGGAVHLAWGAKYPVT